MKWSCLVLLLFLPFSMEDQVGNFEQKHQTGHRWKPGDQDFSDASRSYSKEKQESLHRSMKAATVKRQFLLKLKAKYAGIQ